MRFIVARNRSGHDGVGRQGLGSADTRVVLAQALDLDVAVVAPLGSIGVASVRVVHSVDVGAITNNSDEMVALGAATGVVEDSA